MDGSVKGLVYTQCVSSLDWTLLEPLGDVTATGNMSEKESACFNLVIRSPSSSFSEPKAASHDLLLPVEHTSEARLLLSSSLLM